MGHVGGPTPSVPMQISQLAHILYDALMQDPVFNAPILEILQTQPENPSESNLRLFTTSQLSHRPDGLTLRTTPWTCLMSSTTTFRDQVNSC